MRIVPTYQPVEICDDHGHDITSHPYDAKKPDKTINSTYLSRLCKGPDHLESTILKITGKTSLLIYKLLFQKIVDFLLGFS